MTFDPIKAQMSSLTTSLKVVAEGSDSLIVPPTSTSTSVSNVISHGFQSDQLLWQVGFTITFSGGGSTAGLITPWQSGDGQTTVVATIDSQLLTITGSSQTVGSPTLEYTLDYSYRILAP